MTSGIPINGINKGWIKKGDKLSELTKQRIGQKVKGQHRTDECKLKLSKSKIGENNPMFGKKHTQEWKDNLSFKLKGQKRTPEQRQRMKIAQTKFFDNKGRNPQIRSKHEGAEYVNWRTKVFQRDNWTCQTCQMRGVFLQAHHIKSWRRFPELRYDINNGITLCKNPCHLLANKEQRKNEKIK